MSKDIKRSRKRGQSPLNAIPNENETPVSIQPNLNKKLREDEKEIIKFYTQKEEETILKSIENKEVSTSEIKWFDGTLESQIEIKQSNQAIQDNPKGIHCLLNQNNDKNNKEKLINYDDKLNKVNDQKDFSEEELKTLSLKYENKVYEPSLFCKGSLDNIIRVVGELIANYLNTPNLKVIAKLGFITKKGTYHRLNLPVLTESIVDPAYPHQFVSDMTPEQHNQFNQILNKEVTKTKASNYTGSKISCDHLCERDLFFPCKDINEQVRMTVDSNNKIVKDSLIIKKRLASLDILCPSFVFDFQILINQDIIQNNKPNDQPEFSRVKNQLSYHHEFFKVDLSQVKPEKIDNPNDNKNKKKTQKYQEHTTHELEVNILDLEPFRQEYAKFLAKEENQYYHLVRAFLSNVRMLAKCAGKPRVRV